MPNKPTKRERKDEAKKRRLEEMRRRQRRARMRKLYTYASFGVIILAIVGAVGVKRASNTSARTAAAKLAASAGCEPPKEFPIEGAQHIAPPSKASYKTDPPTSGAHWNVGNPPAPAPTGVHQAPLQDEQFVHNLEHGHIAVLYKPGSIDAALVKKLEAVVQKTPTQALIAPRPNNRTAAVAFAAWGIKQNCASPNGNVDKVAAEFIKRFKGLGPEKVPGHPLPAPPAEQPTTQPSAPSSPKSSPAASPKSTAKSSPQGSAAPATP